MALEEMVLLLVAGLNRVADALEKMQVGPVVETSKTEKLEVQTPSEPTASAPVEAVQVPAGATRRLGRPRTEVKANGHDDGPTHEDALAIATKVAEKHNRAVVGNLVFKHTGAGQKIVDLPREQIPAFIASARLLLDEREVVDTSDL
jgi:hypothetical protein